MVGKIMIVGLGELGFNILQFAARTIGVSEIIAADKDETSGIFKVENVIDGAAHQGFYPQIQFVSINLFNIEKTSDVLEEVRPNVLVNATTMQSWWMYHTLPDDVFKRLHEAGMGPQTPLHLTLTYKLMQAIKKSGISTKVVNCSYSDVVNPILSKIGLAPTVGGGNFDLLIPKIRRVVAERLKVHLREVKVYMIGHHGLLTSYMRAPFWVKILVGDKNVSRMFPIEKLRKILEPGVRQVMGGGRQWIMPPNQDIASSFLKNILAIYFNTGEFTHAPGPAGMHGGYPIRIYADRIELTLPEDLSLEEAVNINEEDALWDGIERIKDDGTLVFTDKAFKVMKETLGYECKELKVEENEERAKELLAAFKKIRENVTYKTRYNREN